jgi:aminomethyltransferase
MTRIEAGFILSGIDYFSSRKVVVEARKSTPFEVGLGWMVKLERPRFVGRDALAAEKRRGSRHQLVGLELDWEELESLYASHGLPASLPAHASREPLPVYAGREQAGRATSHTWSPVLKKPIALATVRSGWAGAGTRLEIEHTVEFERRRVTATVVPTPFFDPERKRKP